MGLSFSSSGGGGNFETHPQGAHAARITRIVDLGTQMTEYLGQTKFVPKLMISWETAHLLSSGEHAGKPSMITARYTASMHEKAQLRKLLEGWKGANFTDKTAREFQISSLLGATCMINVIHSERGGKTYSNVMGLMKLPAGMPAPAQVATSYIFDLDKPDDAVFAQLSPRVQEVIKASPEYERWMRKSGDAPYPAAQPEMADAGMTDDDIPF